MDQTIPWPDGKRFAFTIFDDTDNASLESLRSVYALLEDCGLRTTKSVWPLSGDQKQGQYPGQTCEDPDYLQWVRHLQAAGFEIGWHGATWHGMPRPRIVAAMDRFAEHFHQYPLTGTVHSDNEGIYWGDSRLTGGHVPLYNALTLYRNRGKHRGHIEGDEYFWGDVCQQRIKYFRNFVFREFNTLKVCPFMPYHDPKRPYVNYWFASADGKDVNVFNRCLSEAHQDRLEEEGGACIMYTHFASGFSSNGTLDRRFQQLIARMARKDGWFVPVATLLDHLLAVRGHHDITDLERRRLERKWLVEKIFLGTT